MQKRLLLRQGKDSTPRWADDNRQYRQTAASNQQSTINNQLICGLTRDHVRHKYVSVIIVDALQAEIYSGKVCMSTARD